MNFTKCHKLIATTTLGVLMSLSGCQRADEPTADEADLAKLDVKASETDEAMPQGERYPARNLEEVRAEGLKTIPNARDRQEIEILLGIRDIPAFRVGDLLSLDDLVAQFGSRAPLAPIPLFGLEKGPNYNDLRFPSRHEEELGVVLQYWHFPNSNASRAHFTLLKESSPTETNPIGIASEAFFNQVGEITRVVANDFELSAVIALSCQLENCHVPQLMSLMRQVIQKIHD